MATAIESPAPENSALRRVRVAVDAPVHGLFDYICQRPVATGARVRVPFGFQKHVLGVVVEQVPEAEPVPHRVALKPIGTALDQEELLPAEIRDLIAFTSRYYHHGIGQCYSAALPVALRQGKPARITTIAGWTVTTKGKEALGQGLPANACRQQELLELLKDGETLTRDAFVGLDKGWRDSIKRMITKGWVRSEELTSTRHRAALLPPEYEPSQEQADAIDRILAGLGQFRGFLLDGVTGSGKTEVYIRAAQAALAQKLQVLVLVPEIGITPQTLRRFQRRLDTEVVVFHSGLTDTERADAWLRARSGKAGVVVGTRSAIFTPMPNLGLILIDEEHDRSYKQHESLRYNARDLAVWRAQRKSIPIVLGSATPSLESFRHARDGRYEHLVLSARAGLAKLPGIRILEMSKAHGPIHPEAFQEMHNRLKAGEQVLVFLNRRGWSPSLRCASCGRVHECPSCDVSMVVHEKQSRMNCHWCGHYERIPHVCPSCGDPHLIRMGHGTERLDELLASRFPRYPVIRVDRDTTRTRGELERRLDRARSDEPCILIGTQMLAKGHDLQNLTLVVIVNSDGGLFSPDLRAQEWLAQTLIQVSGRAGRAEKPGVVLVQTQAADHWLFETCIVEGYHVAMARLSDERRESDMPPYSHVALLRFSSPDKVECRRFGLAAQACASPPAGVICEGPVPAPRSRIGGRWQYYFLVRSPQRPRLHQFLHQWTTTLARVRKKKGLRWVVDVDPYEFG